MAAMYVSDFALYVHSYDSGGVDKIGNKSDRSPKNRRIKITSWLNVALFKIY